MTISSRRAVLFLAAAATAATVALAGCGGSDDAPAAAGNASTAGGTGSTGGGETAPAGTSAAPDPCSLLTTAQISTALGDEVGPGTENAPDVATEQTGLRGCVWEVTSQPGKTFFLQVTTDAAIPDGATTASALYDQTVGVTDGLTPGTVGDKSAFAESGGFVLAGHTFLSTQLTFGKAGSAQIVQTLTAAAVANLP